MIEVGDTVKDRWGNVGKVLEITTLEVLLRSEGCEIDPDEEVDLLDL